MQTYTTEDELLGAIDALNLPKGSWIASDADGTLWASDVADEAWRRLLEERRIRDEAADAMAQASSEAVGHTAGEVHADAALLYEAFAEGRVGDDPIIAAMTYCYAGWTEAEVRTFAGEVYRDRVAPRVYSSTRALLFALRERGYRLAVVSGSPRLLVEEALNALGVTGVPVLGIDLRTQGGTLSTEVLHPLTWGAGKVEALGSLLAGDAPAVAFGDTRGDLPLLEAATALRVLVHPRRTLREAAEGSAERSLWSLFTPRKTMGGLDAAGLVGEMLV